MCGIIGMIAKKPSGFYYKELDVFDQLLFADTVRGPDSTGVITVEYDGSFHTDKEATTAEIFQSKVEQLESYKRRSMHSVALIGHNRKSTVGHTADDTAHPFVVNDCLAMVHNGTLYQHHKLAKTDVDSEALAMVIERSINNEKPVPLEDTLGEVDGAYACVWYNQKTHSVQMIRNSQRPLCLAESDDYWFFASEGVMLAWILGRNGIKPKSIEPILEDVLHTFKLNTAENTEHVTEKLTIKKQWASSTTVGYTPTLVSGGQNTTIESNKKKYKAWKSMGVGKPIDFDVTDYVPAHFPETGRDFLVMGVSPSMGDFPHIIKAKVNLDLLDLSEISYLEYFPLRGIVTHIQYDKKIKKVEVLVEEIEHVPYVPSGEIIDASSTVYM